LILSRCLCYPELSIALGRAGVAPHSRVQIHEIGVRTELSQNDGSVYGPDMDASAAIAVKLVPAEQIHYPCRSRHFLQEGRSYSHFSKYVSHGLEDLSCGLCALPP